MKFPYVCLIRMRRGTCTRSLRRGMVVEINPKGKHNNEKTVEKPCYEKPEWRDMMIDINSKGKYKEEEVAEKQMVAPEDAPRLGREENEQKVSQMEEDNFEKEKTEKKSKNKYAIQGEGLDDAKEAIEINEVDVVREDCTYTSLKATNKELELLAEFIFGIDDEDTSEAKDEASKNQENNITYFTRQSSTKPEAARRYVILHC
jgi:hypothetical protein